MLKRKIRNFVELTKEGEAGYNILIKADKASIQSSPKLIIPLALPQSRKARILMTLSRLVTNICQNYFDVRTFGAVMSTGDDPCGIVRGPVQLNLQEVSTLFCSGYHNHKTGKNNRRQTAER